MWDTVFPTRPEGNRPPEHLSVIGAERGAMMPNRIDESLRWFATYTPHNVAVVSAECAYTYAQLWGRVRRLSDSLLVHGLRAGDRVALLMQNSHRYLELYHTAALLGAAVVPLNFRCNATEIEYVINHSGAGTLVFDSSYADMISDVRSRLPAVERYVCAGGQPQNTLSYERLVEAGVERDQG